MQVKTLNSATSIISPLSAEKQQQVIEQTHVYIEQAVSLFNIKNKTIEISFNLKGRAAGMYRVSQHRRWHLRPLVREQHIIAPPSMALCAIPSFLDIHVPLLAELKREIRYNSFIFSKYYDDNFITTIPHEVAHYVSDMIYGLKNIKPHGKEWKTIMQAFGANPSVTANYDLSGIPLKKQTLFTYQCCCQEHQLSTIRHNKHKTNTNRYYCKSCKQVLQYKQQKKACV